MTLVNADTGEVVSGGLVIAQQPTSLAQIDDQCAAVEAWAERCDSVPDLRDAANKLAAIDEYLNRTSIEGRGRVAAAMRRLEARIGRVLGPAKPNGGHGAGPGTGSTANDPVDGLTKDQRNAFRNMAENEETVEAVLASSTDDAPATRAKVLRAIKDAKAEAEAQAAQRAEDREALAQLARDAERAGMDMDGERLRQRGEFKRLCRDLAALPAPAEFLARQGEWLRDTHYVNAEAALTWLTEFHALKEAS